jgi:biopolymer transport protein ExbB/TolQ
MTSMVRIIGGGSGDGAYDAVLKWVLFAALMGLSAVILWDYGMLQYLFSADTSRISVLIAALFIVFMVHSLWIVLWMAREYRQALIVADLLAQSSGPLPVKDSQILALNGKIAQEGVIAEYLRNVANTESSADRDRSLLLQSLSASLKRRTKVGVYGTDLLYKLGMLGTMIGFVIMLNSMGDMKNFDVETLRSALQRMIGGMAVSLLTTIAGLVGGILLRIFYNLADGLVIDILQTMVETTETSLGSRLVPESRAARNV